MPSEQPTEVTASSLATVTVDYHSDIADHAIKTYRPSVESWEIAPMRFSSEAVAPLRRTEYVSALAEVRWASAVVWNAADNMGVDLGPWTTLEQGQGYEENSLAAPLAPGVDTSTTGIEICGACRQEDNLTLNIAAWSSGGRLLSGMSSTDSLDVSTKTSLYADGQLLATATSPLGSIPLPRADATLTLESGDRQGRFVDDDLDEVDH